MCKTGVFIICTRILFACQDQFFGPFLNGPKLQKSTISFVFLGKPGKANQCISLRVKVFSPGYFVVLLPKTPKFLLPRDTRFLCFSPEPPKICIYWICYFIPGNDGSTTTRALQTIDRTSFVMASANEFVGLPIPDRYLYW